MQPENQRNNSIKNHGQIVWLTAVVLSVLVAATVAVVGMCLYNYAHRSDCEISLYQGQISHEADKNLPEISHKTANAVIKSQATSYKGTQAKQQSEQSAFQVKDADQVWKTETAIELFEASYKNADGVVTVKSADGDKVIAPGTEGSYTFSLKNTSTTDADYKIWVEAKLSNNMTGVPLETRMSGYNGWLLGGKDQWQQAEDLDGVATEETIAAGKTAEYTIYWQWPFERNADDLDTNLGNQSTEQNANQEMTYTVTIYTLTAAAAGTGDSQAGQNGQKRQPFWQAVKTGDQAPVLFWCMVLMMSLCVIVGLLILKKRKNDSKNEHQEML